MYDSRAPIDLKIITYIKINENSQSNWSDITMCLVDIIKDMLFAKSVSKSSKM